MLTGKMIRSTVRMTGEYRCQAFWDGYIVSFSRSHSILSIASTEGVVYSRIDSMNLIKTKLKRASLKDCRKRKIVTRLMDKLNWLDYYHPDLGRTRDGAGRSVLV